MKEYEEELNKNRFISEDDAKPNNSYHRQEFPCPKCGSWNTGQSTYTDWCNTCGWGVGY